MKEMQLCLLILFALSAWHAQAFTVFPRDGENGTFGGTLFSGNDHWLQMMQNATRNLQHSPPDLFNDTAFSVGGRFQPLMPDVPFSSLGFPQQQLPTQDIHGQNRGGSYSSSSSHSSISLSSVNGSTIYSSRVQNSVLDVEENGQILNVTVAKERSGPLAGTRAVNQSVSMSGATSGSYAQVGVKIIATTTEAPSEEDPAAPPRQVQIMTTRTPQPTVMSTSVPTRSSPTSSHTMTTTAATSSLQSADNLATAAPQYQPQLFNNFSMVQSSSSASTVIDGNVTTLKISNQIQGPDGRIHRAEKQVRTENGNGGSVQVAINAEFRPDSQENSVNEAGSGHFVGTSSSASSYANAGSTSNRIQITTGSPRSPPSSSISSPPPSHPESTTSAKPTKRAVKTCLSAPQFKNSDTEAMKNCIGENVGEACEVKCLPGFHPTQNFVRCVQNSSETLQWDLRNAKCRRVRPIRCLNRNNRPVDWYVAYRLPRNTPRDNGAAVDSLIFISNKNAENLAGPFSPGDFPLANTFMPLEMGSNGRNSNVSYFLFGNGSPARLAPSYGNSEGIIIHDAADGLFLLHNKPAYPTSGSNDELIHTLEPGQLVLCVSFKTQKSLPALLEYVSSLGQHIYENHGVSLPSQISQSLRGKYVKGQMRSMNGTLKLYMFRTAPSADLYSEVIAEEYGTGMEIFSWPNSQMNGQCSTANFKQILEIAHPGGKETVRGNSLRTPTVNSYSKWAVDRTGDRFCLLGNLPSDSVNHGSVFCLQNEPVAMAFRGLIVSTDCEST